MRGRSLSSGSVQFAAASVRPASSSMSCRNTPRLERNTEIRGRWAVPRTLARTRRGGAGGGRDAWRRSCALAHLPGDVLALVADALPLVGLGRAALADVGRDLPHELLGDPAHDDAGGLGHLELDALGRPDRHRVAEAKGELEVRALLLGPVADALDLERLGVAVGDADDHVRHERARETVQGAVLAAVGRALDEKLPVLLNDLDVARNALGQLALRPLDRHAVGVDPDLDAVGDGNGLLADSRHRVSLFDLRHDLAADARLARLVAGHDAARRRDDRRAHAAEDLRHLVGADVDA